MPSSRQTIESTANKVLDLYLPLGIDRHVERKDKMNIDERIERLVERHEALSQSVELLTSDVRELTVALRSLASYTQDIAEGTARLLRTAEAHEQRISDLEAGNQTQ